MIKINIKNLTHLVEAMECVIDKGTTGNDFYLYHKEYKHAIVLLMTEASDVIPEIYELYTTESLHDLHIIDCWIAVIAKYIGFTGVEHMMLWFDKHPKIWTREEDFYYFLMSMAQPDYTSDGKTKAQRITEQFRDILELSIKEENR